MYQPVSILSEWQQMLPAFTHPDPLALIICHELAKFPLHCSALVISYIISSKRGCKKGFLFRCFQQNKPQIAGGSLDQCLLISSISFSVVLKIFLSV